MTSWNSSNNISSQTLLDWAEMWWEAQDRHGNSKLLKLFWSNIQDGLHSGHLENLQITPVPKWSDWAKTWWEAMGWHGDLELLKLFCCHIQDGHNWGHFENIICSRTVSWIEPHTNSKLDWAKTWLKASGQTWRFRTAKDIPFWYPRWSP